MFQQQVQIPYSHYCHPAQKHKVTRQWTSNLPTKSNLIYPIFVVDGENQKQSISSMEGVFRYSVDVLVPFIGELIQKGLNSILIFGVVDSSLKDESGSSALDCCVHRSIKALKHQYPQLLLITDVCLCAYTTHGHCGILNKNDQLDNQASINRIAEVALSHVKAGADMIAPSDMMDGRVLAIKKLLHQNHYDDIPLMAYSAKFCSALYGPFRDVCGSKPTGFGRESYQLPTGSKQLALRAVKRDIDEGADFVMVKPISAYLDIVSDIRKNHPNIQIACYHVSGEYAMICKSAEFGLIDKKRVVLEYMESFKRAGVDIIITYFTPQLLEWL